MKDYTITMATDDPVYNGEITARWSGYGEQSAIAQAMLYYAQNGSRSLKVLEIKEI